MSAEMFQLRPVHFLPLLVFVCVVHPHAHIQINVSTPPLKKLPVSRVLKMTEYASVELFLILATVSGCFG